MGLGTLCFVVFAGLHLCWAQIREPVWRTWAGRDAVSPLLAQAANDEPIVVSNAFDYLPEWWYASPALRGRLIYLVDVPYALRQPDFLPELSLALDRAYAPMPTADYAGFTGSHAHFLLLCTGETRLNWIAARLSSAGWQLKPIVKAGNDVLYQVDRP
jgi:hypothetical protein